MIKLAERAVVAWDAESGWLDEPIPEAEGMSAMEAAVAELRGRLGLDEVSARNALEAYVR